MQSKKTHFVLGFDKSPMQLDKEEQMRNKTLDLTPYAQDEEEQKMHQVKRQKMYQTQIGFWKKKLMQLDQSNIMPNKTIDGGF